jgi:hypothetical protein
MNQIQQEYDRDNNTRMYILNNSNPYLISPSSSAIKQQVQANQPIITVDTIETTIPGATVFIGAPINVVNITVNGVQPSTDKISAGFTTIVCNPLSIVNTVNGSVAMRNTPGTTVFANDTVPYIMNVYGQLSMTTGIDTTAKQLIGHVPIAIGSVPYFNAIYSGIQGGGSNPTTVTTDTVTGTDAIDPYTNVTFLASGSPHALPSPPASTNIGIEKYIIQSFAGSITVTGSFRYNGTNYSSLQFTTRGSSVILNFDGTRWIVVVPNPDVIMT